MLLKYQERQAYVCQIQGCRGVKQSGKPADHNWRGQGEGYTERKKERVSRGGGSSQYEEPIFRVKYKREPTSLHIEKQQLQMCVFKRYTFKMTASLVTT